MVECNHLCTEGIGQGGVESRIEEIESVYTVRSMFGALGSIAFSSSEGEYTFVLYTGFGWQST
jgi:hypothetical protein